MKQKQKQKCNIAYSTKSIFEIKKIQNLYLMYFEFYNKLMEKKNI